MIVRDLKSSVCAHQRPHYCTRCHVRHRPFRLTPAKVTVDAKPLDVHNHPRRVWALPTVGLLRQLSLHRHGEVALLLLDMVSGRQPLILTTWCQPDRVSHLGAHDLHTGLNAQRFVRPSSSDEDSGARRLDCHISLYESSIMFDTIWFHRPFPLQMKRALAISHVCALLRVIGVIRWRHDVFCVFVRIN